MNTTGAVTYTDATGFTVGTGGADAAGTLGLSSAELSLITAGALNISSQSTNPVTVRAAITRTTSLAITGDSISASGAGSITPPNLALTAGTITLNGANDVDFLSLINNSATASPISFSDADGFALGTPSTSFDLAPWDFSTITFAASSGTVVFRLEETISLSIGAAAHDQIVVTGGVTLDTWLTTTGAGVLPFDFFLREIV